MKIIYLLIIGLLFNSCHHDENVVIDNKLITLDTTSMLVNNMENEMYEVSHYEKINESRSAVQPDIRLIEVVNTTMSTESMDNGHIVYKIPSEMLVRNTYEVIVRISKSTIKITNNLNGVVKTSVIPITETMEVRVIDPSPDDNKMFSIVSDNKPVQLIENNSNVTQWTFNVTPLKSGNSKLKIVVSIVRNGVGKEVVYEDNVHIKSNIKKTVPFFITTYWQWLMSVIIIPLIGWLYKKYKK